MHSILFPGQGSQYVGMGQDLYDKYDLVKKIYHRVDKTLGYSLSDIILNGPESKLKMTENTQPAIMTIGVSIFSLLKQEFNFKFEKTKFFAGHSLGEYTALVCANSLSIETAASLLHKRGKFMQAAVAPENGGMLAVLGISAKEVSEEIKSIENIGVCEIANDNCPGQIVVSGDKNSINSFSEKLKKRSIRIIPLPVSAPFHCSLMNSAAERMSFEIHKAQFQTPNIPIISNVNAKKENNVNRIKNLLIEQITARVRWRESVEYMIGEGVNNFLEIGPGKVLSGLVKRISKNVKVQSINNIEEITNYAKND